MFTRVDLYSYLYVSERKWTLADPLPAVVLARHSIYDSHSGEL